MNNRIAFQHFSTILYPEPEVYSRRDIIIELKMGFRVEYSINSLYIIEN